MSSSASLTPNTQLDKNVSYGDLLQLGDLLEEVTRDPVSDSWSQPAMVSYSPPLYPPPHNHRTTMVHNQVEMGYSNGHPYYQQLAPHQDLAQNIGYGYAQNTILEPTRYLRPLFWRS